MVGVGGTCAFYICVSIMLHSLSDNKFRNYSGARVCVGGGGEIAGPTRIIFATFDVNFICS